eukprot:3703835-Rhodomonas_salina.1
MLSSPHALVRTCSLTRCGGWGRRGRRGERASESAAAAQGRAHQGTLQGPRLFVFSRGARERA